MKRRQAQKVIHRFHSTKGHEFSIRKDRSTHRGGTLSRAAGRYLADEHRAGRGAFDNLRPGTEIEFKNAIGLYRARILSPQGTAGSGGNSYQVRILSGPDMHDWMVDLPASLITKAAKSRKRR